MPHYQLVTGYEVEESKRSFCCCCFFVLSCWVFCFVLLCLDRVSLLAQFDLKHVVFLPQIFKQCNFSQPE